MVEVDTNAKEVKEADAEAKLPEDTVTLELVLNTRDYVVLKESMSLTRTTRH